MDADTIQAEITRARTQLSSKAVVDAKNELVSNIYPLLSLILGIAKGDSVTPDLEKRVELLEGTVTDYLMTQESMILPALAMQLTASLSIGLEVCTAINKHFGGEELVPKEIGPLIAAFGLAARDSLENIAAVTVEDEVEEDEDDDEDDFDAAAKTSVKPEDSAEPPTPEPETEGGDQ